MIYFTADTHFLHKNVVAYSSRPFATLDEMTEQLIANWNAKVTSSDQIYHLGDFAISYGKRDAQVVDDLLSRLNGQKFLVIGNHDRDEVKRNSRWIKVVHYEELKVDLGGEHKQRICLSHYAMRTFNQSHRGSWMLHGHSHGTLADVGGKIIDVGVDAQDYRPVSVREVAAIMAARPRHIVDHHTAPATTSQIEEP